MRRNVAAGLAGLMIFVVLMFGVWWGGHPDDVPGFLREALGIGGASVVLEESLQRIADDYYVPVKESDLLDGSLAGIVASLHDRFSAYLTPAEYRDFLSSGSQSFSGIGTSVSGTRRGLHVVSVVVGSPAARAGILAGDTIVAVDGQSLAGRPESVAIGLVKGPAGTRVTLRILHRGHERDVAVRRAKISEPVSVVGSRLRTVAGKKVADVSLGSFIAGAHGEVRSAIDKLLARGARAVILDLRDDGGGLVEEARLVASIFLADGPIVTTRGRTQPTITLTATGDAIPASIPVVVLVNGDTASAAEIVTGALQDRHRATIVGTHTFGKGVFQEVWPLSNGGALDITAGEYYLPSGRNLGGGGIKQGGGITPDVVVPAQPTAGHDPAVSTGLHLLAAKLK